MGKLTFKERPRQDLNRMMLELDYQKKRTRGQGKCQRFSSEVSIEKGGRPSRVIKAGIRAGVRAGVRSSTFLFCFEWGKWYFPKKYTMFNIKFAILLPAGDRPLICREIADDRKEWMALLATGLIWQWQAYLRLQWCTIDDLVLGVYHFWTNLFKFIYGPSATTGENGEKTWIFW